MAKLLYIESSPRGDRSTSAQVARAFLESYQKTHPDDQIRSLNVFDEELPTFDGFTLQAKYSIMHGKDHSPREQQAWQRVEQIIADFKDADKYLLSLPMWNFSIPYRLKQYIDILVQPGYTFTAGDNGYEGLVKDKPMAVIYARGGAYPEGTEAANVDLQKQYIELILAFIGIVNIQTVIVEPSLQEGPEQAEQAVKSAEQKAETIAKEF